MSPTRSILRAVVAPILALALGALASGCASVADRSTAATTDSTAEAYAHSVAALLWPGVTRAFQVTPTGDLFNGNWFVRLSPAAGADSAAPPKVVAYEDRWCPIVRWTRWSGPVRWEFEAVTVPEAEPGPLAARGAVARELAAHFRDQDRRTELAAFRQFPEGSLDAQLLHVARPLARDPVDRSGFFVSLSVAATNTGAAPESARFSIGFDPAGPARPYFDADSIVRTPWESCWIARSSRDSVLGFAEGTLRGRTRTQRFTLAAGERRALHALLPVYPAPPAELERWRRTSHVEYAVRSRTYWRNEVNRGARFDVPDPELRDALRAARVVLLSLRERRTTDWVPIGGPFQYRDVWLRDGARAMQALAVAGYTDESHQLARSFLQFQWPNGPFVSQAGQMDGSGQALWAFEQVLLRPAAAADVRQFAQAAHAAWRALERQRAMTRTGERGVAHGMLPVAAPRDNELVRAQIVGNDAWALAGYRAAVRLLRAAGMRAEADSVERSRREYLAAFEAALAATGRADVPPSWQGAGIDWGNLNVGYPCAALAPTDPHLAALARRYWAPVGGAGLGYYRVPDSLHTYVAADLGTWALLAGERAMADSVLDAMLRWRTASGAACEIFSHSGRDFGRNFPPHPTAAAALIALTRNALLFDDSDTLQLTLGARASWWRGTRVRGAPTRWGLLRLEFQRTGEVAEWHWSPVPVWSALTLPPGTTVDAARSRGVRMGARPDVVLAPPGADAMRVALISARTRSAS